MGVFQSRQSQSLIDVATTYQQAGNEFMKHQCYKQATYYFEKALNSLQTNYRILDERKGKAYYNLARSLHAQGHTEEALTNYRKSLRVFETIKCNEEIPTLYNSIAEVFLSTEQGGLAMKQYKQGLSEVEVRLGENHSAIGSLSYQIAVLHLKQDNDKEATEYLNRALKVFDIIYGANSIFAADCFNLMGLIMKRKLKYEAAYDLYVKALTIREKNLPQNHIDLATSYCNVGLLLKERGMLGEAFLCLKKCLKIEVEKFGLDHQRVVSTLKSINFVANVVQADLRNAVTDLYASVVVERKTESIIEYRGTVSFELEGANDELVAMC